MSDTTPTPSGKAPLSICDECGKGPRKIWRLHRAKRYCGTCYAREFEPRPCPGCGQAARLPRRQPDAVCRRCEASEPCHRCRRPIARLGKFTEYGAVCAACARYYADPRPCDLCGDVHARLEAVVLDGESVRACLRCARAEHRTCQACHRHRKVRAASDGRLLCRPCDELGTMACPECHADMPVGYGPRCRTCDGRRRLGRRVEWYAHAFAVPAMATHFVAFGEWLGATVGPVKAARTIKDHVDFFLAVESRWGQLPDYAALCTYFGTAVLRKSLLVMRWLEDSGRVRVDAAIKRETALRGQIERLVERVATDPATCQILETYREALMARHAAGKLHLRSVKSSLSAAAGLVGFAAERGLQVPDQAALENYVAEQPGQHATLAGVVRHLREVHGAGLRLVPATDPQARRRRRQVLERDAERLVDERAAGGDVDRRWRAIALELYHDLPPGKAARVAGSATATEIDGGAELDDRGVLYYVPNLPRRTRSLDGGHGSG